MSLTATRITSFEVKCVAGDWSETTKRWMAACQRNKEVANIVWETWSLWHHQNGSRQKLREWLEARQRDGVKAAGKCPVAALPAELSRAIYRAATEWAPELQTKELGLLLKTITKTMTSRKAVKGNLPGHSAILLLQEARPSFTRPFPLFFGPDNSDFLDPVDGKNLRLDLRLTRVPGERGGKSRQPDVVTLRCTGQRVRSQLAILKRIVSGEYAFRGSQLVWSQAKRRWFVRLCYRMPVGVRPALDPERSAVLYPRLAWPISLLLPDRRRMPGGRGRYIAPVRRQLLMQRWNRRGNYRNAGQANKGHGRERAGAGPQWKLQQRWKDFCKRVNHGLAREVVEACELAECGRLVFYQPESDWGSSRFLTNAGKVEGRTDSTGWPWFQLRTFLAQKSEEKGIELVVIKRQGRGLRSVKSL